MRVTRFTALCSVLLATTVRAVTNNIVAPIDVDSEYGDEPGTFLVSFNPSTNTQLAFNAFNVQPFDGNLFQPQPYGLITTFPVGPGTVTVALDILDVLQSLPYNLSDPVYFQITVTVTQQNVPSNTLTSLPHLVRLGDLRLAFTTTTSYPITGPTGTITMAETASLAEGLFSGLFAVRTVTTEETISGSVVTETLNSTFTGLTQTVNQAGPTTTSTNSGCWQYSLTFASGCCPTSVLTPRKGPQTATATAHRRELALDSAKPTALAKQRRTLFEPTVATVTNHIPTSTSVCRAVHVPEFTCPRSPFFGFLAQQFLNFYKARAPANFPILSVQCDGSSTVYTY